MISFSLVNLVNLVKLVKFKARFISSKNFTMGHGRLQHHGMTRQPP